jgi:hypothetical protein
MRVSMTGARAARAHISMALVVGALAAMVASPAAAYPGKFGLGIIVGEPTGIDGKLFLDRGNALDMAAAWSLSGDNDLHLQIDYLYHRYSLIKVDKGKLPLFFGLGGRVEFRENRDDKVGLRIPVGLAYEFADAPFDIFGEIVPVLELTPDTDFELEGALGVRFWF